MPIDLSLTGLTGASGPMSDEVMDVSDIDYKEVRLLIASIPERGKIQPRRLSGTCAKHQRKLLRQSKRRKKKSK